MTFTLIFLLKTNKNFKACGVKGINFNNYGCPKVWKTILPKCFCKRKKFLHRISNFSPLAGRY